ncbi:MAG TPA: 30S ribosomal protein S1 [Gammaproteobacteria bacterium]|mgnify:CR=1 FL=1|jgi:small subunit ribosomal protein S1|nr:30S ribosomal protein S1 [Gammaproteobacteria bacterium]|tara:strand:+ start:107 stop:1783 length:1677 start_codon:yes stop_codon:yes gene_type:complete
MNENFESLFENSQYSEKIKKGQIIQANVIQITSDHAVLNAGLKSEALVNLDQFKNIEGVIEIEIGDTVEVAIEEIEDGDGHTKLSRQKAKNEITWNNITQALNDNSIISGMIKTKVKGGFTVSIDQINAFLPGSLVDIRPIRDTGYLEGTLSEFKIIKADRKINNVVVSRKAAIQGDNIQSKTELLEKIKEGETVEGIVKNLTDYGAFIDLGGIDGLLHITDISWKKVKHPSQYLTIADNVKVKILGIDKENLKISLGLKQLDQDPWEKIIEKYTSGMRINCEVTNIKDYGLFVEIEEGMEGLVHVSEIDWTNNNPNPQKVTNIGDEIEVMILEIDNVKRRVSLGIKQCQTNPWTEFSENHSKNEKITGTIKSITDFGIFVGLEGGIDGLIHISDLSWKDENEIKLSDYKKGDKIETQILSIEPNRQRISLGLKQLLEDPFTKFCSTNPKGTVVKGTVSAVEENLVLILINEEINGLLSISEVSRDRVQDMRSVIKPNETIEAIIIGFNKNNRTVKLSIKAKEESEEKEALASYKSEESESIAKISLGDLLKSKIMKK